MLVSRHGCTVLTSLCLLLADCGHSATGPNGNGPPLLIPVPDQQGLSGSLNAACPGGAVVTTQTLIAWGGSPASGYTWTLSSGSSFPAGTTVDPLTGIFHGTGGALVEGTHSFGMTVSDGSTTANGTFTFVAGFDNSGVCGSAVFEQSHLDQFTLPDAAAGSGYGAALYADGDGALPWTWSLATGTLPAGLVVDQSRGVVRGTPASSAAGQTFSFTANLVDHGGHAAACPCATYVMRVGGTAP
jgi:hypothetical protein